MSRDAMQEHDQRINGVLRKAFEGHGWTPVDDHTPLDAMMDAEPEFDEQADAPEGSYYWPSEEQPDLELRALKNEEALQVAAHAREQMARWIAGGAGQLARARSRRTRPRRASAASRPDVQGARLKSPATITRPRS